MAMSNEQVVQEFNEAVNMTRQELEDWLQTEESKSVGQIDGGGESKGHKSGRKIVEILGKNRTDYSSEDIELLRRGSWRRAAGTFSRDRHRRPRDRCARDGAEARPPLSAPAASVQRVA